MTVVIDGTTGIDAIQDGVVSSADIANGAVTAAKLSGAQTGSAPVFGLRAWCTFNGSTGTLIAGGNVTSVARTAQGDYTVTFTTALPTNYALAGVIGTTNVRVILAVVNTAQLTTTTARFQSVDPQTSVAVDEAFVSVMFVG